MLICSFCEITNDESEDVFSFDKHGSGFWCEDCDGYTYFETEKNRHKFTLILEDKIGGISISNGSKIKFQKQISPFRYPGGKSKIVEYLFSHLQETKTRKLISPFTGGGSFELALLQAGVIEELHMNDLDVGVFSVWWVIKHMPDELIHRLKTIEPKHRDYFKAQTLIKTDFQGANIVEAAWATLMVNRLAFSGIYKANPMGGKKGNQKKLLTRWNPKTLIKRIEKIHQMSDRITITQENAVPLIEEAYWNDDATIFIDPPYVEKGKDLYHCYYKESDHIELSNLLDSLYHGVPGADILVTYDYNEWLEKQYLFPETKIINRTFSI